MIYKYKTEGISPKDVSNYQNLIHLFINLRDGNIKSRYLLKNEIKFKLNLSEIKKENQKSKTENQVSVIQNTQNLLI